MYKGPKPRGLVDKGTPSSAGAATVAAATVVASRAPHQAEGGELGNNASESNDKQPKAAQPFTKGMFKQARRACREFLKSQPYNITYKPKPRLNVSRAGVFEKAVKVCSQPLQHVSILSCLK